MRYTYESFCTTGRVPFLNTSCSTEENKIFRNLWIKFPPDFEEKNTSISRMEFTKKKKIFENKIKSLKGMDGISEAPDHLQIYQANF